ncbi:hypothetical protein DAEQUDRAFT_724651 [Daedalea quercina L-15889]|uniref:Protein kinase domain-containing protein n=1 Tax=Daedalea quercina L-15889 TaxID=1314783 RepID=A0A165RLE5_9APHY|nr:hypothetical protein DAEQUDRAFT_724651 [Daedalea quercina L-15889]
MLQYPIQLPPLSLTSSKRMPLIRRDTSDDLQNGSLTHKRAYNDKLVPSRPSHVVPIHVSTAFPSASSFTSTPPSPSPNHRISSKQVPRSPLVSSSRQLPSPVPRSPHPLKSNLSSFGDKSSGSSNSSVVVDVLSRGDLVGEGLSLQGETIVRVPISSSEPRADYDEPAKEFEVVRTLGTGSYAVVYLVREILSRPSSPPSDDEHGVAVTGSMEMDDGYFARHHAVEYGREYAIKVLSKANLDRDALDAQLFEATIHQSLPAHPNIVTLHRTLETPSFLLLLLEFVPGEDLFYFLEQARDHYEVDPMASDLSTTPPSDSSCSSSRTPSSPSLLSSLAPSQLLSRTRLRLIASMFSQMCEAVATCHDNSVFHRDIKPENFIVTDGWTTLPDGRRERKVVVKLTDFGLSTTDTDSADMDCGSAPYMSFECRNNLHPTYSPRAADVWSLGIVLINMLYHYNPWTDAAEGACSSFEVFRQSPAQFFMTRFAGMTQPVAEFLATKVFCLLDGPRDSGKRISARAFGNWVRDLPTLLGGDRPGHARTVSISSVHGYRLASIPHSRRPSLRSATPIDMSACQRVSRSMSRAPSLVPAQAAAETSVLSTVPDQENEEQEEEQYDIGRTASGAASSRSVSTQKRRKRGARKGKGTAQSSTTQQDATLNTLAEASQTLAREISRTSRHSQGVSTSRNHAMPDTAPPAMVPGVLGAPFPLSSSAMASTTSVPVSTISKKPSKWKLSFGKASSAGAKVPAVEETLADAGSGSAPNVASKPMSSTASNVTNLLMSLNAPPAASSVSKPEFEEMGNWSHRGRRANNHPYGQSAGNASTWGPSSSSVFSANSTYERRGQQGTDQRAVSPVSKRGVSPTSTRSGRPLASSASSMASSNWRSSMSSAGTSTSAFTRYSNGSTRSVATAATSVSSGSWRSNYTGASKYSNNENRPAGLPANVKFVQGTPWEIDQPAPNMPRRPGEADRFGGPPQRKPRRAKPTDSSLDTISERPQFKPVNLRTDAATSTTDLSGLQRERYDVEGSAEGDHDGPRKVQKGQINALAKMLSALRR